MQETTDYKKSVIMGLIRGHKDLKKYDDNVIKRNTLIHNNFNEVTLKKITLSISIRIGITTIIDKGGNKF